MSLLRSSWQQCRYVAKATLESETNISQSPREALEKLATPPRSEGAHSRMEALRIVVDELKAQRRAGLDDHLASLFDDSWKYVYREYFMAREKDGTAGN